MEIEKKLRKEKDVKRTYQGEGKGERKCEGNSL